MNCSNCGKPIPSGPRPRTTCSRKCMVAKRNKGLENIMKRQVGSYLPGEKNTR